MNTIQQIANETETSKAIFNALAERQRLRKTINMNGLQYDLMHEGKKVNDGEFRETFKKLEGLGVGSIVIDRKKKTVKFVWDYSLKQIAKIGLEGGDLSNLIRLGTKPAMKTKGKVGRPVGWRKNPATKPQLEVKASQPQSIVINLPSSFRKEDLKALVELLRVK